MKGARGLLISITGGKRLTLYEVDEAATRIREEVDPDANIIVGATFDESLDGIIRVSVVATGIDANATAGTRPAAAQSATAPVAQPRPAAIAAATAAPRLHPPAETLSAEQNEARIAELAQRLKADNARVAERSERADQAALRSAAAPFQQPVQHRVQARRRRRPLPLSKYRCGHPSIRLQPPRWRRPCRHHAARR